MSDETGLFALPPEDLSGLDDAELAAAADGLRGRIKEVHEGRRDPEVVGERTQSEVASEMQAAVLAVEAIQAEITARTEQDQEFDKTTDELAARAGVKAELSSEAEPEPEAEPKPKTETTTKTTTTNGGDDDKGDEEEATTASATPAPATPRQPRPLPAARRHRPIQSESDDGRGLRVTSHAAGLGAPYDSQTVLDRSMLGNFLSDVVRRNRVNPGQKAVLAHASFPYPSERILDDGPDSHLTNTERVRAAIADSTTVDAMVASGGLCAPLTPIYDLPGVETSARPVRAALPSFMARRGGVQVGATPTMGDYAAATDVVTAAQNEAGGTNAVKNCMRIVCPDFTSVEVDSIYQCIEADNLASRAYPELMARIADLVDAEQARLADSKLLTAIKAGSTNVTGGTLLNGAVWSLFGDITQAAAGIRSRHRMSEGTAMQALLPAWVIDLLLLDTARAASQDNRSATRAAVDTLLRQGGIIPTYYLDGPSTGTGQIFGAQSAGALARFPEDLQWAIFPAGTWLHLDAGELQLGVVRDSTLNSTNDFQIFEETWENVAYVGVESLWVTTDVCPSGTYSAGIDNADDCGTS